MLDNTKIVYILALVNETRNSICLLFLLYIAVLFLFTLFLTSRMISCLRPLLSAVMQINIAYPNPNVQKYLQ